MLLPVGACELRLALSTAKREKATRCFALCLVIGSGSSTYSTKYGAIFEKGWQETRTLVASSAGVAGLLMDHDESAPSLVKPVPGVHFSHFPVTVFASVQQGYLEAAR